MELIGIFIIGIVFIAFAVYSEYFPKWFKFLWLLLMFFLTAMFAYNLGYRAA